MGTLFCKASRRFGKATKYGPAAGLSNALINIHDETHLSRQSDPKKQRRLGALLVARRRREERSGSVLTSASFGLLVIAISTLTVLRLQVSVLPLIRSASPRQRCWRSTSIDSPSTAHSGAVVFPARLKDASKSRTRHSTQGSA